MKTLFASVLSAILLTACGQTVQEAPSSDPKVENQRITFPEKSMPAEQPQFHHR